MQTSDRAPAGHLGGRWARARGVTWLVDPLAALVLLPAVAAGLAVVALAVSDVDAYARLIAEDGPVEYASAILWLVAAGAALAAFLVLRRGRTTRVTALLYAAAVLFFVVAGGEEISWGQRLIGYEPPAELLEVNKQREANVHNIGSISVYANAFFMLLLAVFVAAPLLRARNPAVRAFAERHALPAVDPRATAVYLVVVAVWAAVGIRFGTLGFHPFSAWGHYTQMDDEIFELGAAYAAAALAVCDLVHRLAAR